MPNIDDLGLPDEPVGQIDNEAPEGGTFPPQLQPGFYDFVFHLEDDPWDVVNIEGQKYLQVAYKATTTVQVPDPDRNGESKAEEVELRFQRVNFYKHPKVPNSSGAELIRAMGLRIEGPLTKRAIQQVFEEADGRRSFRGEVGWRYYCKSDEVEVATHTRKKKVKAGDQVAWPKDKDGKWADEATCPKCKVKGYGNAEVVRYKLPSAEEQFATQGAMA